MYTVYNAQDYAAGMNCCEIRNWLQTHPALLSSSWYVVLLSLSVCVAEEATAVGEEEDYTCQPQVAVGDPDRLSEGAVP